MLIISMSIEIISQYFLLDSITDCKLGYEFDVGLIIADVTSHCLYFLSLVLITKLVNKHTRGTMMGVYYILASVMIMV